MTRLRNKNLPTVYAENGMHYVMLEDGKKIKNIISTVVTDDCYKDSAVVQITLNCNIAEDWDDALSIYDLTIVSLNSSRIN